MPSFLLGFDIGTSVTKAAIFDRTGHETAVIATRTNVLQPQPGWSEMDPETAWRATADVCAAVLAAAGLTGQDIAGVGIAGVMVGAWLVDKAGAPIRPAILWNDGRAQEFVNGLLAKRPALMSEIFASSGSVMQMGCTLPVVGWLARHEPATLSRAHAILTAKDFIRLKLTGEIGADESEAAVAPGSARGRGFHRELLAFLGLPDAERLLPKVGRSEAIAGTVTAAAAAATGLKAGTPVAFGAGDTPASVIGAGAGRPGLASTVLGTTCLNGVLSDEPIFEPADLGLLFTVPGGLWMKTMVNVAGTTNIDWCLHALCPDLAGQPDAYDRLAALADAGGVGASGVVYVPYLSPTGIIAPRIEAGARAGFCGLDPNHRREHLVRALYEGVAFAIRDCYAAINQPFDAIRLAGGGARSAFWSQMIADVTGNPTEVPTGSQFGAKGAALLAGIGIGWFSSVAEACAQTFALERRHEPNAATAQAYQEAFARYRAVSLGSLDAIAATYR
jgi:sugar (pentulose or hexulose) kinase